MIALAFALTVVVEGVVARMIVGRRIQFESFAIQLTTWPIAQWLLWRGVNFWSIEVGVVIVEMALWRIVLPIALRRAATVSVGANAVTAGIGWLWLRV